VVGLSSPRAADCISQTSGQRVCPIRSLYGSSQIAAIGTEVATALRNCRHLHGSRARTAHDACSLIIGKPEDFVLPERTSDGVTELVLAQFSDAAIEVPGGVEFVVAQEFKHSSMNAVGSGLGYRIHHTSAEFSIFGIEAVGNETKFLN